MSLPTRDLWFLTPLQALVTIGSAMNFGGSALQTPLIMPMLKLDKVPIQHSSYQLNYLLHESEKFFPPLNMLCTLSNIAIAVTAYLNKDKSGEAAAKLPYALVGSALNIATTVFALTVMVPMNRKMGGAAGALDLNPKSESAVKIINETLPRWQALNLVRASFMIAASVTGLLGLLADGAVVKVRSV